MAAEDTGLEMEGHLLKMSYYISDSQLVTELSYVPPSFTFSQLQTLSRKGIIHHSLKKKSELFFCCHSNEVLYFDEVHGEWLFPLHMEV